MTTILLYVLFALPAATGWHGALELATFSSLQDCERAAGQLQQARGASRYHCETEVVPEPIKNVVSQ